jgi:hypothetical protein
MLANSASDSSEKLLFMGILCVWILDWGSDNQAVTTLIVYLNFLGMKTFFYPAPSSAAASLTALTDNGLNPMAGSGIPETTAPAASAGAGTP